MKIQTGSVRADIILVQRVPREWKLNATGTHVYADAGWLGRGGMQWAKGGDESLLWFARSVVGCKVHELFVVRGDTCTPAVRK